VSNIKIIFLFIIGFTNSSNPTGLLLLCDVALGNMYEKTGIYSKRCNLNYIIKYKFIKNKGAEYVEKLPSGKHSTKGVGRTHPDPSQTIKLDDGVTLPIGKGVDSGISNSSLLYNEYVYIF
jgi:hypothetical protein